MDSHVANAFSNASSHSPARDVAEASSWRTRIRQVLVIGFEDLEEIELDLGTPKELDEYVCDLFERAPCKKR